MIIVSVHFAKNPDAKQSYNEAIKHNPEWAAEIAAIIKATVANPSLGTSEAFLSDEEKQFVKDKNIHKLDREKGYKKAKARSASLSEPDNNPATPKKDKYRPRLVYTVKKITSPGRFDQALKENNESSLFKVQISKDVELSLPSSIRKGNFGYLVLIEIGGHYKHGQESIHTGSATHLWDSTLDTAFAY